MTSIQSMKKRPDKALICLHGAGSSGPIFRIQLAKLRLALEDDFEFIFVTAPTPSIAGPGMLPLFAGAGPFYRWFAPGTMSQDAEINKIHEAVRASIDLWESTGKSAGVEIVGIVGFSQGAVAATMLMWQQQNGDLLWLPRLQFGVLICSDLTQEVVDHLNEGARRAGAEKANLIQPTLHIHGLRDPFLAKGRRLLEVYEGDHMHLLEFDGGHHCPNTVKDCGNASRAIREVSGMVAMTV